MKIAKDNLNPYALLLEEAQEAIRELVKTAFLHRLSIFQVNERLEKIIRQATKDIAIPRLQSDARLSLINFANKQRMTWEQSNLSPEAFAFIALAVRSKTPPKVPKKLLGELSPLFETDAKGVPLQRFYQNVFKERVMPTLDRLAKEQSLDPHDFVGRNSLRNLAEMEVRYHDHEESIAELKTSGTRLVVCSAHADCSDRCAKWQGRVYSLDGTSGVVDGHRYVPLENATNIYYTSPNTGRTYKNGLLGFNCRHSLSPYRGELLPTVSAEERKKEYAITRRQREYERDIRSAKAQAMYNETLDPKKSEALYKEARKLYSEYKQFSRKHDRAYYPMRVRI